MHMSFLDRESLIGTAREMMGYYKEAVEGQLTLCSPWYRGFFFVCVCRGTLRFTFLG
jgi:hypothetical protein